MHKYLISLTLILVIWLGSIQAFADGNTIPENVRIGLYYGSTGASAVTLKSQNGLSVGYDNGGTYTSLYEAAPNEAIAISKDTSTQHILVSSQGKTAADFEQNGYYLYIKPKVLDASTPAIINVNGKNYRGMIEIRRYSTSDMTVINVLPLEEYLYGVVPREIGPLSPLEAIKAQAVCARNYSLKNIGKNAKWGFDMTNTVSDQAYGGYDSENPNSNMGVEQTKGKRLLHNGSLASVFYFSTSGGKTEDSTNVWGSQVYPYLVSVDDKYEPQNCPKSNWQVSLTSAQIKTKLKAQGVDIGDIVSIQPTEFSSTGRVIKLLVQGTAGQKIFEKDKCRTVFGADTILSQWYTVSNDAQLTVRGAYDENTSSIDVGSAKIAGADQTVSAASQISIQGADSMNQIDASQSGYKFTGKGWGHGVGMSQQGAIGMAKAGFTYDQILAWYFKGTTTE